MDKTVINNQSSVSGVIVPVVTPVDENERVDEKSYRAVLNYCLNAGVDGVFVGGSAGMGPLLTEMEWKRAMGIARSEVNNGKFLLGGVICTSTAIAIERIKFLEKCGYDYMVVTPTYYITLNDPQQFFAHFDICRQSSVMEMVVYNIPSCTYSQIPLSVLEKMAEQGFYKTIKESSGNRDYFSKTLEIAKSYGISVLQGNEPDMAWGLSNGAGGIVPVCANYEPGTFVALWQAHRNNDKELMRAAQSRIDQIRDSLLVKSENWIAGIMYGVSSIGMGIGKPVRPLSEISDTSKKRIDALNVINIRREILDGIN